MPYKITVTRIDSVPTTTTGAPTTLAIDGIESEIYRQTLDELDLSKFVIALNKTPRTRKAKQGKAS